MQPLEVAVVGAGIIGLAIALRLAELGAEVGIYERDAVGAGASGVQPGGVRLQWGTEVNCRMALESVAFWDEAEARLEPRVGFGWRACGYLWLAHSERALDRLRANVELQHRLGIPSELVSPARAAELVPGLDAGGVVGAAWCGRDGYFDRPQGVVEAFAEAVRRRGVEIAHEEVVSVERGRVRFRRGGSVEARHVVVAAGAAGAALLAPLWPAPITEEERFLFYSEPIRERLLDPLVVSAERQFAAKQLGSGRVLASDLGAHGDPAAGEQRWRARVREVIRELLPRLEYVSFPLLAPGVYDVTPDRQPILGRVPGHERLWLAAGFSGHGFMMAPAVGRAIAEAIRGGPRDDYLRVLSPERFARAELVPEPAVV